MLPCPDSEEERCSEKASHAKAVEKPGADVEVGSDGCRVALTRRSANDSRPQRRPLPPSPNSDLPWELRQLHGGAHDNKVNENQKVLLTTKH